MTTETALDCPINEVQPVDIAVEFRVHELAKQMRCQSKDILRGLRAIGKTPKSASSRQSFQPFELRAFIACMRTDGWPVDEPR